MTIYISKFNVISVNWSDIEFFFCKTKIYFFRMQNIQYQKKIILFLPWKYFSASGYFAIWKVLSRIKKYRPSFIQVSDNRTSYWTGNISLPIPSNSSRSTYISTWQSASNYAYLFQQENNYFRIRGNYLIDTANFQLK